MEQILILGVLIYLGLHTNWVRKSKIKCTIYPRADQPTNLKATQTTPNPCPNLNNTGKTRRKPYPPNFNKTPAKIIEPETGAST
jgi:hypothetical protein